MRARLRIPVLLILQHETIQKRPRAPPGPVPRVRPGIAVPGGVRMGNGTKGPPDTSLELQGTRTNIRLILIPILMLVLILII